jgi:flavodoxin
MNSKITRCLIAYFSRKGKNYVSGSIVNLTIGNTEIAAEIIKKLTGSEIFRIQPVKTYPEDYAKATEVAKQELVANARPQLAGQVGDMDSYEVIFLGYPNWWGTMPMPVCTFLEEYDFSGKTIAPFCTHEGSGLGRSEKDIAGLCPNATVLPGLAIRGGNVKNAQNEVSRWLREIGMIE